MLTGREVGSDIVWEVSKSELAAYCLITFVTCARHGSGQTIPEDLRPIYDAGIGSLTPLPPGVLKSIDVIGVYALPEGCNVYINFHCLAYYRTRQVY